MASAPVLSELSDPSSRKVIAYRFTVVDFVARGWVLVACEKKSLKLATEAAAERERVWINFDHVIAARGSSKQSNLNEQTRWNPTTLARSVVSAPGESVSAEASALARVEGAVPAAMAEAASGLEPVVAGMALVAVWDRDLARKVADSQGRPD